MSLGNVILNQLKTKLYHYYTTTIQDLFFRYEYNNFLHTQVVQCLQTVLANAVTVTSEHTAPFYSKDQQNEDEQSKDDEDYAKKDALLLTHVSVTMMITSCCWLDFELGGFVFVLHWELQWNMGEKTSWITLLLRYKY